MKLTLILPLILMSFFSLSAEQLFSYQPSVTPEFANVGELPVGVRTLSVVNNNAIDLANFSNKNQRSLTLEIWYPTIKNPKNTLATYQAVTRLHKPFNLQGQAFRDADINKKAQYPLVVLSHGYTGDRTLMFYLAEHLASHGYVVAAIDHTDSTTKEIDFKNAPFSGFMSTLLNRSKDQQFVLDYLSTEESFIQTQIDTNNSSVIGYSMGGYGAINTVGGCYQFTPEILGRFGVPKEMISNVLNTFNFCNAGKKIKDTRWKAMIAFAPWGQELNIHTVKSLTAINTPTLYVSGDQDDISGYEQGVKRLFEQTSVKDNYLLTYQNARHNIAGHPAPQIAYESDDDMGLYFEPSWNNEQITRINKHMALLFLDCYVKNKAEHCQLLPTKRNATQKKQVDGKYTKAWPGFNERWATGIEFIRAK
jgi:predicted dienelactone hydrolase